MQMPELLKRVENRFPEKLANVKDLADRAIAGKSKYIKSLVPIIGEYDFFSKRNNAPRKAKIVMGTVVAGCRAGGLLASVITGNPIYLTPYGALTTQEELFTWAYESE